MARVQLYYITDRLSFSGNEPERQQRVLRKIEDAARAGVDFIQLREKDLGTRDLERLAEEAVRAAQGVGSATRLLINSRLDVALAVGADGVHLRSDDISPGDVRKAVSAMGSRARKEFLIAVSCHSAEEVRRAEMEGADFAVFAPVFEKKGAPQRTPAGLKKLREACRGKLPVFALGGITLANAQACLDTGAAGVAAIRLFQENPVDDVVHELRGR